MFIREISVSNFMIHRRTKLALYPMTVLVGPNNSGKSSLFDALLKFSAISSNPIQSAFPSGPYSYRARHYNGDVNDEPMCFNVAMGKSTEDEKYLLYEIAFRQISWKAGQAEYEITHEHLVEMPTGRTLFDRATGEIVDEVIQEFINGQTGFFAGIRQAYVEKKLQREGLIGHVAVSISRFGKYRLDPSLLNKPGPIPDVLAAAREHLTPPRMNYEGEGLASVLYFLDRTRDPRMELVIAGVASAVDGFEGFEFNAIPSGLVGFSARFSDSRGVVEAPNLSAGTLSLIGWLTLLQRGDRQPVLMLEEPELGLTPRSTKAVYDAAREAATSAKEPSQLLISSHSPHVLNWAAADYGPDHAYVIVPRAGVAEVSTYEQALEAQGLGIDFTRAMSTETANQIMHGF